MFKQNLAFIDIETTGLNLLVHEIIQIGVVLVAQNVDAVKGQSFEVIEEFELKIKPTRIEQAERGALRVNGYSTEDWVLAYSLEEALKIFAKKTEGAVMVAHNVGFDWSFIAKAFAETGVVNKMHFHKLDTISIAYAKAKKREDIEKFSLYSLCQLFGIENKNAHTALSDSRATFELYKKLIAL